MNMHITKNWHKTHQDNLTLGERAADHMRNGMGSWKFVGGFLGFMCLWALLHGLGVWNFDPFPFILLNLFLSMLAGLQGAILLIAAKRSDSLSGAMAQNDYDTNVAAKKDLEDLKKSHIEQTKILEKLQKSSVEQSKVLENISKYII